MQPSENTEKKILHAAREEFIQTGFNGARMQAIADRADVNKALLHYYFRSKRKLYEAALLDIMETFWTTLEQEISIHPEITDFNSHIRLIVETHIRVMSTNPYFPRMILREIADGGTMMAPLAKYVLSRHAQIPVRIYSLYQKEIAAQNNQQIKPVHLILNILGMCLITFLVQPFAASLSEVFKTSLNFNEQFMKDRIDSIISMIKSGISSKDTK